MSLVVDMHQLRTVASGRHNQDPNTPVAAEKERAPKTPKLERSMQEVLNHKRNISGRGRLMVLAALQKQAAAEKTPPAASKASPAGKSSGRSAKKNSEGARSGVVPVELTGNKLSFSDNRKRPLEHEEIRARLTALNINGSTPIRPDSDFTSDWTDESPAKPSPRDICCAVAAEKERAPKTPKLERSMQEVLNHKGNISGRGRLMVLAALQKQAAAEKTPPGTQLSFSFEQLCYNR
ncbi:hypothetical protein M758_3G051000 [Ceratodon purpureus]|nr:hypothetical protein M758_3G051000 [Ceratodon purpureus]